MTNSLESNRDTALLILRIGLGLVFIAAGLRHVIGLEGYTNYFGGLGIPAHGIMAPFVAWLELLGGIAILLGAFTRAFGGLLAIVMAVAIFAAKIPAAYAVRDDVVPEVTLWGLGGMIQAEVAMLTLGVVALLLGGGKYAIDHMITKKKEASADTQ
jgi:putative oxidoreductase